MSAVTERPSLAHRIVDWLGRWAGVVLAVAVVMLSPVSGVVEGDVGLLGLELPWSTLVLIVLGPLALGAAVVAARQTRRLVSLEGRNRDLEAHVDTADAAVLRLLRGELERLEALARHFSSQRVSLYRREEDQLVLVARRSRRPEFDESLGRFCIPLDQGCVGKAWSEGSAYEPALPSAGPDSGPPTKRWLLRQERLGVPQSVAAVFTMRSQTYAAFRIETREERLGVLVFESTLSVEERSTAVGASPTLLTMEELQGPVKDAGERLCTLVQASRALPRDRVKELLCAQQCPGGARGGGQEASAAAAARSSAS
jgi:hypothetical protein